MQIIAERGHALNKHVPGISSFLMAFCSKSKWPEPPEHLFRESFDLIRDGRFYSILLNHSILLPSESILESIIFENDS